MDLAGLAEYKEQRHGYVVLCIVRSSAFVSGMRLPVPRNLPPVPPLAALLLSVRTSNDNAAHLDVRVQLQAHVQVPTGNPGCCWRETLMDSTVRQLLVHMHRCHNTNPKTSRGSDCLPHDLHKASSHFLLQI